MKIRYGKQTQKFYHEELLLWRTRLEILAIYEPYIRKTTITFEYEVPTVEAFRRRMAGILGAYPYLVWKWTEKSRLMPMPTASRSGRPTSGTQSFPYMWVKLHGDGHGKSPVSGP